MLKAVKRSIFKGILSFAALGLLVLGASALYVFWLPDVTQLRTKNPSVTSFMLIKERQAAAKGRKLGRRMVWKGWWQISPNLKHAVLISEDRGFYRHHGIDWESTLDAAKLYWKTGKPLRGGSTITQQLARNLYLSPSKNPLRKIKEMLIARRLEKALGKRRIFELYLNVAEWGKGIYGAEAAAQAYFGRAAADLTPEEAAALAATLPSPRRYNPVGGTRFMERRKSQIVARMRASGFLPDETEQDDIDEAFDVITSTGSADEQQEEPQDEPRVELSSSPAEAAPAGQ